MLKPFSVVLLIALAGVANATPVLNVDLNLCNSGLCGAGGIADGIVVAKVSATDTAAGLSITVDTQDPGWVLWGQGLFGFNAKTGGTLVLPNGYDDAGSGNEDGFGTFQYRINGPRAGGLAANGLTNFSFIVTGLQVSDIVPNPSGHLFAAHIGVLNGGKTGFVTDGPQAEAVPEPGTFGLLGAALIGFGFLARRFRLR